MNPTVVNIHTGDCRWSPREGPLVLWASHAWFSKKRPYGFLLRQQYMQPQLLLLLMVATNLVSFPHTVLSLPCVLGRCGMSSFLPFLPQISDKWKAMSCQQQWMLHHTQDPDLTSPLPCFHICFHPYPCLSHIWALGTQGVSYPHLVPRSGRESK